MAIGRSKEKMMSRSGSMVDCVLMRIWSDFGGIIES